MTKFEKCDLKYNNDDFVEINPLPFIPGIQPEIPLNSTISIYGRRRSGKSEFTKWCIQGIKEHVPWWWTFSLTKHNSFWAAVQPNQYIIGKFDADVLNRIKERQIKALDAWVDGKIDNPHSGIIWDDYNGNDIKFNSALADYYYTGRHFGTINFFNAQYINLTPPPIRSNTEIVVLFNTDYGDSIEQYRKDFAAKLQRKQWLQLFREKCEYEDHGFLAIVADKSYEEGKFYYGKADLLPINEDQILGCPEYWKGSEKQLELIKNGEMQKKYDLLKTLGDCKMAKPRKPKYIIQ